MTLKEIQRFIKTEYKRMVKEWGFVEDRDKRTLFRTIKLMEEMGEFCDELLGSTAIQRQEKNRDKNKEKLAEELVDIIHSCSAFSREFRS